MDSGGSSEMNQTTSLLAGGEVHGIPKYVDDRPAPIGVEERNEGRHDVVSWALSWRVIALVGSFFVVVLSVMSSQQKPRITTQITDHASFPSPFVWGSATSSYQVEGASKEGGRGTTIWDTFCTEPGRVLNGDTGDVACDHYHLFEHDVKLMKELGLKAYRFSIAWSRIFPGGSGEINPFGIAFYNQLIDLLLENDIEPWVTLYHWDLPQALHDKYGGWLSRDIVEDFGDYARECFAQFGDRVKHWITVNEPWAVAVHGFGEGIKAPGRSEHPATEPYIVAHNLILAHARAARIYRRDFAERQHGRIGMSNSGDFRYPARPDNKEDRAAAERAMEFQLAWFCDPIWKGEYPTSMRRRLGERLPQFTAEERAEVMGSSDFLGLNHYSSVLAGEPKVIPSFGGYWADIFVDFSSDPSWKHNQMGWPIVPDGCRELLIWIDERYRHPKIYITENGSAEDESDLDIPVQDHDRRDYFEGYIRASAEAIEAGVDLRGYFAWSFMDNFEWEFGYTRRFGLYHVDFETGSLERTPKLSATWYRETIKTNGRNIKKKLPKPQIEE